MDITGKKISIIGAVRSGIAAAKLCKRKGGIPFVSDYSVYEANSENFDSLTEFGIEYEAGGHTDRVFDAELIVTSPGVPSDSDVLREAANRGIKIVSELEFAAMFCRGTIIGITGTNGKTTTTSLCGHVLEGCGLKTYVAGNIGLAFSELTDSVSEEEYVVLEISSFQLDYVSEFKPKFSTILNITPDHLDRYDNIFENYIAAKTRVARKQDETDYFLYNADDKNTPVKFMNSKVNKLAFSLKNKVENGVYYNGKKIVYVKNGEEFEVCSGRSLSIRGEHNLANAMAVCAIACKLGLSFDCIKQGLKTFPGVEHRMEFVREFNGAKYINDSKATNVDSVWYALRSFDKNIILILGGKDKGNDYTRIADLVKKRVKKIYAVGSSSAKVYEFFKDITETVVLGNIEECVKLSAKEAVEGDVVLLSPACASFDQFKSYEHRGQVFKGLVNKL